MKQQLFEERYAREWEEFDAWLKRNDQPRKRGAADGVPGALPDADFPARYRRICQHLALARDRQYSAQLVDRLNHFALRGHNVLYGARDDRSNGILTFIFGGFSRLVRGESRVVVAAGLLFFVPLAAMIVALQFYPDFIYYLMQPAQVEKFEKMYSPTATHLGRVVEADSSFQMFGMYIWNNVRIGFQTFAGGLLFGVGSIFYLIFNGILIGAVAGHLTQIGYVTPFYSFVSGHSGFELMAVVLSGAAGLKIGYALIAPGQLTRKTALMDAARTAVKLVYGAAGMFLIAAFIEAFWSPLSIVPPPIKYAIGVFLWLAVIVYLMLPGRGRAA